MKFEIKFTDKASKFEKTSTIECKDEADPYKWAEKQIEVWNRDGKLRKLKYTITCLDAPKPKPKVEVVENDMTRKLNNLKKKIKTVK